jgi:hypothetical protein
MRHEGRSQLRPAWRNQVPLTCRSGRKHAIDEPEEGSRREASARRDVTATVGHGRRRLLLTREIRSARWSKCQRTPRVPLRALPRPSPPPRPLGPYLGRPVRIGEPWAPQWRIAVRAPLLLCASECPLVLSRAARVL